MWRWKSEVGGQKSEVESWNTDIIKCNNRVEFPKETMIGALANYISTPNKDFQPMNANFGILPKIEENKIKDKKIRYEKLSDRAINTLKREILQKN